MGGYAWVTLATNDSYSLGALVLAHSLKQVGTQQQLAVLVTPGVTNAMRDKLRQVFDLVQEVNILDSRDEANLRLLKRPELGITFTKLHCWRLTQFDKCVFLDADTLVLENCDELFEREELSAAPDVGWPDCFNSGVFVYRPSNETYEKLIQFALERGSFDGGDQGLLNLYFSDWAHKDISKHLPFIYNMCSTATYSYLPAYKQFGGNAKIIHFIGATKPWLQYFDTESRRVHPSGDAQHLKDVLQHWWNIFCSLIHPNLTQDMTPSHTDTVHGSQPYIPPRSVPPPDYYTYHHVPTPNVPNPAEDYQNVWDPWEEYDFRQSQNQSNQSETIQSVSYDPTYFDMSGHNYVQEPEIHNQNFENHYHPPENQNQWVQGHNKPAEIRQESNNHSHHVPENHSYTQYEAQIQSYTQYEAHIQSHSQYEAPIHHIDNNQQNKLVESHNTKACFADHHDSRDYHNSDSHNSRPPPPTYSQTQFHPVIESVPVNIIHHEPPPPPTPQKIRNEPPPPVEIPCPRLPDECVATTTVSNDITLNTGTNEDTTDNSSGLAGAFAQLTLGTPRTAEQSALDDHLRRQGWEVGNIDYLGRDSFDNIWSKICETLSTAPETTPKAKAPSPPTSDVTVAEEPPAVISKAQETLAESTPVTEEDSPQIIPAPETVVDTPASEIAAQTEPQTAAPAPVPTIPTPAPIETTPPVPVAEVPQTTPELQPPSPQPTSTVLESPQSIPAVPESPQPVTEVPSSPQPAAISPEIATQAAPEIPSSPQPVPTVPESIEPPPTVAETVPPPSTVSEVLTPEPVEAPQPIPAVLESSQTTAVVTETPQPVPVVPDSPQPAPIVPESPQSTPVVPESPQNAPVVPESPQPVPVVPESIQTAPVVLESPQPTPVVPESPQPAPVVPECLQPAPVVPESPQPAPVVPECPQPAPVVPESPQPAPVIPESSQPVTVISESPLPASVPPETPEPVPVQPAPVVPDSPQPAPESTPVVPESPKPVPATSPSSKSPAASSKISKTKTAVESSSPVESPQPEPSPQVCPIASKPEKKAAAKKSVKEPPKTEAAEAAPTAASKQSKQASVVDTSVPDPPSASAESSATTPTPPPRKSSGAPKKTSTKPKK